MTVKSLEKKFDRFQNNYEKRSVKGALTTQDKVVLRKQFKDVVYDMEDLLNRWARIKNKQKGLPSRTRLNKERQVAKNFKTLGYFGTALLWVILARLLDDAPRLFPSKSAMLLKIRGLASNLATMVDSHYFTTLKSTGVIKKY